MTRVRIEVESPIAGLAMAFEQGDVVAQTYGRDSRINHQHFDTLRQVLDDAVAAVRRAYGLGDEDG